MKSGKKSIIHNATLPTSLKFHASVSQKCRWKCNNPSARTNDIAATLFYRFNVQTTLF